MGLLGRRKALAVLSEENREHTLLLAELLATGDLVPVIDRTHDLAAAAEAVQCLEQGHTQGKVVVTTPTPGAST